MGSARTDAVGVLRWGLRRYWWLLLLCVAIGAVLAPKYIQKVTAPSTDATALVVAEKIQSNPITLPRYGEAVFNNGQVAQAVAAKYGKSGQLQDIIPNRVSLTDQQNSIVFQVTGHDRDPKVAAGLANTAAEAFVQGLNSGGTGVGRFMLQSSAQVQATPAPLVGSTTALAVAIAGGAILGLAFVTGLLVARRPVILPADAEEVTGVLTLGAVRVPRTRRARAGVPEAFAGLAPVCRQLLALPTSRVMLVSRRRDTKLRRRLSVALASAIQQVRDVHFIGHGDLASPVPEREVVAVGGREESDSGTRRSLPARASRPELTLVDSTEPLDLVQPPRSTAAVLVARQGISSSALQRAVVEQLGGSAVERILLVRR